MPKIKADGSRRKFLKTIGVLGSGVLAAALAPSVNAAEAENQPIVPRRPFGKTGEKVSILGLGGGLSEADLLVFRQAVKLGITYWDTADSYRGGRNETAIGKYLAKFPEDRKKLFIVTKAATSDPEALSAALSTSLQRMNTQYIDLYFIHYLSDVQKELTPEVKQWAEKTKAQGKIRFFGFSAHKNMEKSMQEAARLGWIDAIMVSYNYRIMGTDPMRRAVAACAGAGIGLTAMKTQAAFSANFYATIGSETDMALKMTETFLKKGFSAEQAKLKAVWEEPHIASICSFMPSMAILQANAAAALDKTQLSRRDRQLLELYARQTAGGYCMGCTACESALITPIPISDLMRCAMYANGYKDRDAARALFRSLPGNAGAIIHQLDFSKAEQRCPQAIQIARVIKELCKDFA